MKLAQDFTKVRKLSSNSSTVAVSLKEDIFEASGFKLGEKVYMYVEEGERGKKRIVVEKA